MLDKLDYCSSLKNLDSVKKAPNFKVGATHTGQPACRARLTGPPSAQFVKGDIQSMDLISFVLQSEAIDTVMHFAAQVGGGPMLPKAARCAGHCRRKAECYGYLALSQTHVDNSFGNSLAFTMNNTYGTHVLLEACRKAGTIRRFINVSTDEVYGETSHGKEEGEGCTTHAWHAMRAHALT